MSQVLTFNQVEIFIRNETVQGLLSFCDQRFMIVKALSKLAAFIIENSYRKPGFLRIATRLVDASR